MQLIECEGTRIGIFIDVVELDGAVGGMAVSYSGGSRAANKPTFRFCAGTYEGLPKLINRTYFLLQAKEAEADEYYLDALAVNPSLGDKA